MFSGGRKVALETNGLKAQDDDDDNDNDGATSMGLRHWHYSCRFRNIC